MMSITGATVSYFKKEFAEKQEKYLSQSASGEINRRVSGGLARRFGIKGELTKQQYERLCEGKHPRTGRELVKSQNQKEYMGKDGKTVKPAEHRPGWDVTFSAPKSVSNVALHGRDKAVLTAHREAVAEAMTELEKFAQAKMGGRKLPRQTGNLLWVSFEHDSDRPVNGFVAPQLHTHNFVMNMTRDGKGRVRALETSEIYGVQHYLTTLYRARLAEKLQRLGYEIERGENGKFEIKGFSAEYLGDLSPRARQRDEALRAKGLSYSAKAAEVAVLDTREKKADVSEEAVRRMWDEVDEHHGRQTEKALKKAETRRMALAAAKERGPAVDEDRFRKGQAREAMSHAIEKESERHAVFDETRLLAEAMKYDIGNIRPDDAKAVLLEKLKSGELVQVAHRRAVTRQGALTTPEILEAERANLKTMLDGLDKCRPMAEASVVEDAIRRHEHRTELELNEGQRRAVREVLENTDRVQGIQGRAGVGKTTVLEVVKDVAQAQGHEVRGLAPTGKAAQLLEDSGIPTETMQHFNKSPFRPAAKSPILFVVDESSVASTVGMREFFEKVREQDRVLLVGDTRQHLSVEAGSPFAQFQDRGMATAHIDEIVRQKNERLREAVQDLAAGQIKTAFEKLDGLEYDRGKGRKASALIEVKDRDERLTMMTESFLEDPRHTLAVAPDNRTRRELNERIRSGLQAKGLVEKEEATMTILVPVDAPTAERKRAATYQPGRIVRYTVKSETFDKGEYARVVEHDRWKNRVTVERGDGERTTYNPRQLSGVEVYEEQRRQVSVGDRIQFTRGVEGDIERGRPKVANRETATVEAISETTVTVRPDRERDRTLSYDRETMRHFDLGYAMTSHSSQGETVNRVLVHAETSQAAALVNERMAYVAISRARYEAQVFTDNKTDLVENAARSYGKQNALDALETVGRRNLLSREVERTPAVKAADIGQERRVSETIKPNIEVTPQPPMVRVEPKAPARIQGIEPPARTTMTETATPRPEITFGDPDNGRWLAARNWLGNHYRWDAKVMTSIDEGFRNGRMWADAAGNVVTINASGKVGIRQGQDKQQVETNVGMARAGWMIDQAKHVNAEFTMSAADRERSLSNAWNLRQEDIKAGKGLERSNREFGHLFGERWGRDQPSCLSEIKEERERMQSVKKPEPPRYNYGFGFDR